jgi:hypothetical protein
MTIIEINVPDFLTPDIKSGELIITLTNGAGAAVYQLSEWFEKEGGK